MFISAGHQLLLMVEWKATKHNYIATDTVAAQNSSAGCYSFCTMLNWKREFI